MDRNFSTKSFSVRPILASDLERCHFNDTVCLTRVIQSYIHDLKDGRPDINLRPIDPLFVKKFEIVQGSAASLFSYNNIVWIALQFDDLS